MATLRSDSHRAWVREAIRRIEADYQRSSDTHLIPLELPAFESASDHGVPFARSEAEAVGAQESDFAERLPRV